MSYEDGKASLIWHKVTTNESGIYTLKAENNCGSKSVEKTVDIKVIVDGMSIYIFLFVPSQNTSTVDLQTLAITFPSA